MRQNLVFPNVSERNKRLLFVLACLIVGMAATTSAAWEEPKRGSDDRMGLMDAIRPHAEWSLGVPIQFVVGQLRVDGDVGYASLMP